ncbi:MAG TPA: hypothetical protein VFN83_01550 [Gemmatimonadales bacterium]|nr:hypothetical protein [Gemmatimonadales bacterium]
MIGRFRRARWLLVCLLAISPGLGSLAVQALHPCPAHMTMPAGGAGHHADHPAGHDHAAPCHCIGSCAAGAVASAPIDGRIVAERLQVAVPQAVPSVDRGSSELALRLLPPSTAPPLTPAGRFALV